MCRLCPVRKYCNKLIFKVKPACKIPYACVMIMKTCGFESGVA